MSDGDNLDPVTQRARALFDDSVERLDGVTRSRLTQARNAAIAAVGQRPAFAWRRYAPAGAVAAAAVIGVALWLGHSRGPATGAPAALPDALEFVAQAEDVELLGDDVEFYHWAVQSAAAEIG
jgi:hypothetical protein